MNGYEKSNPTTNHNKEFNGNIGSIGSMGGDNNYKSKHKSKSETKNRNPKTKTGKRKSGAQAAQKAPLLAPVAAPENQSNSKSNNPIDIDEKNSNHDSVSDESMIFKDGNLWVSIKDGLIIKYNNIANDVSKRFGVDLHMVEQNGRFKISLNSETPLTQDNIMCICQFIHEKIWFHKKISVIQKQNLNVNKDQIYLIKKYNALEALMQEYRRSFEAFLEDYNIEVFGKHYRYTRLGFSNNVPKVDRENYYQQVIQYINNKNSKEMRAQLNKVYKFGVKCIEWHSLQMHQYVDQVKDLDKYCKQNNVQIKGMEEFQDENGIKMVEISVVGLPNCVLASKQYVLNVVKKCKLKCNSCNKDYSSKMLENDQNRWYCWYCLIKQGYTQFEEQLEYYGLPKGEDHHD